MVIIDLDNTCFLTNRECSSSHQKDIQQITEEKDYVFISMKFTDATKKLRESLRKAIKTSGFEPIFADELPPDDQPPHVFCPICKHIKASRFIVADLSIESTAIGFEVALARGLRKGLIYTYCKKIGEDLSPLLNGFISVHALDEKDMETKLIKRIKTSKFKPHMISSVPFSSSSTFDYYQNRIQNLWSRKPKEAFLEIIDAIVENCPVCGNKNIDHWSEDTVFCAGYRDLGPLRLDEDQVYYSDQDGACKYCWGALELSMTTFASEDDPNCAVAFAYLEDKNIIGVTYSPINGRLENAKKLVDFIKLIGAKAEIVNFYQYTTGIYGEPELDDDYD